MTTNPTPIADGEVEALRVFALDAVRYFENRPTNGEDAAHWSNVSNAETMRKIATRLTSLAEDNAKLREALSSETAAREKAEREIASMKEMRKRLDRRIHCQRKSNRDEWEIVERRAKGLRSSAIYCIVAHRDVSIKLRGAETAIADLTRKLEVAAGALVCAEQQCETAVYNISQRDHDDAVVRSFRSIAGYCAREARAALAGTLADATKKEGE